MGIKEISKKLAKKCVICGKQIKVILYKNKSYRNGHYFGKIPSKSETCEYWECPKCYWGAHKKV
jgi:sucrose-6-phosphate hydrolase SacC (GH32 family)